MTFLIIIVGLFCERYLMHSLALSRFDWFAAYCNQIESRLPHEVFKKYPQALLAAQVLPLLLIVGIVFFMLRGFFSGIPEFVLGSVVFYYCLGPVNPFYPVRSSAEDGAAPQEAADYLSRVNGQLFAVIFWFALLGPVGAVGYRLISLASQQQANVALFATQLLGFLDWIPARITALFYLFVGRFQAGFTHFVRLILAKPDQNDELLSTCGIEAIGQDDEPADTLLPKAVALVEHALIVLLACLALLVIVSW